MNNELEKDLVYEETKVETRIGNKMMTKMDFTRDFCDLYLAITLTLATRIAEEEGIEKDQVEVTKFTWNANGAEHGRAFDVEYIKKVPFSKEKIKNAYAEYLKSVGCKMNKCEFSSDKNPSVRLNISVPDDLRKKLDGSKYEMTKFEQEIKSSVPGFYARLDCFINK